MKDNVLNNELASVYKEINELMIACIKKGAVPYVNENPFPQDMNVVSGFHLGDINKIKLELKAANINAKSLKWIYEADAQLVGLELKNINNEPISVFANVKRNDSNSYNVEKQNVFLLDQFTENSLNNVLSFVRNEIDFNDTNISSEKRKKYTIAQNILKNISEYDSGLNESQLRENKRKNISVNLKDSDILNDVTNIFKAINNGYDESQKLIFGVLNNYYIRQETGLQLAKPMNEEQKSLFIQALEKTSSSDSPRLAKTLCDCFFYSERLTHLEFSPERIYTQDDLEKTLHIQPPTAAKFESEIERAVSRKDGVEIDRERELDIKPRQITHTRGGY